MSYQWQRCATQSGNCTNITGATGGSYTLTSSDVGQFIRVEVTAKGIGGSTVADSATSEHVQGATEAAGATASQIKSDLSKVGHPSGKKAITALVKTGSFKASFGAPGAGSLSVTWTTVVTTGTGKHKKHKTVTVASGSASARGAGATKFTIHLTGAGKSLLKNKPSGLSTSATEKFKPGGGSWTSITKKFSL